MSATGTTFHCHKQFPVPTEHGQEYSCEDDGWIYNEGEKKASGVTIEAERRNVKWQVTQVRRSLLSVSKLSEVGYYKNLHDVGGVICNEKTGKTMKVDRRIGINVIGIWIPPKGHLSQGNLGWQR